VAPDAHRIGEEQRLAVELYAGWRGPVRHRRKAIQAPLLIAQTDPLPLLAIICPSKIRLSFLTHISIFSVHYQFGKMRRKL
jgi:hypothetical protein